MEITLLIDERTPKSPDFGTNPKSGDFGVQFGKEIICLRTISDGGWNSPGRK
jgi:hypothetical protein